MKIVFMGATNFSEVLLNTLINNGFNISAIFTIPKEFKVKNNEKVLNSNYSDLTKIAEVNNIPFYYVDQKQKLSMYEDIIKEIKPDIVLALGWYYIVPKVIREIPAYGVCGIHASLLPRYAGWAPLVWALINGERETGVSFFKFDDSVDGGDLICQKSFNIEDNDSISDVYYKATELSKTILIEVLPKLDTIELKKQDKSKLEIWPKRSPQDGEIDFTKSSTEIYNFIRAQSNPYPGAFFRTVDGRKIIIEKARIE